MDSGRVKIIYGYIFKISDSFRKYFSLFFFCPNWIGEFSKICNGGIKVVMREVCCPLAMVCLDGLEHGSVEGL